MELLGCKPKSMLMALPYDLLRDIFKTCIDSAFYDDFPDKPSGFGFCSMLKGLCALTSMLRSSIINDPTLWQLFRWDSLRSSDRGVGLIFWLRVFHKRSKNLPMDLKVRFEGQMGKLLQYSSQASSGTHLGLRPPICPWVSWIIPGPYRVLATCAPNSQSEAHGPLIRSCK